MMTLTHPVQVDGVLSDGVLVDGVLVAVASLGSLEARPDAVDRRLADTMPPGRAGEFLTARSLLRDLMAEAGLDRCAAIGYHPGGQPYLPHHPGTGISVSHSGGVIGAAVGVDRAVGIDVQVPVEVSDALARRCCGVFYPEYDALDADARPAAFAAVWATQEACVKAAGTGLSGSPWRIPVRPGQSSGSWQGYAWRAWSEHGAGVACAWDARPA